MIDYARLGRAVKFYEDKGFQAIEVPWWVSKKAIDVTVPPEVTNLFNIRKGKCLVASAEQSFLYLAMKGYLANKTTYLSVTPCFRDESIDYLHQKCFMKAELFVASPGIPLVVRDFFIEKAAEFFTKESNCSVSIEQLPPQRDCDVGDSFDLLLNGVEVGSYGVRRHGSLTWVYGTGLAEPRFSRAREYQK